MPQDSNQPRRQPGRHRPMMNDLARETTEEDLWDLEGQEPQTPSKQTEPEPEQPTEPEKPSEPEQASEPEKPVQPEPPKKPEPPVEAKQPTQPEPTPEPQPAESTSDGVPGLFDDTPSNIDEAAPADTAQPKQQSEPAVENQPSEAPAAPEPTPETPTDEEAEEPVKKLGAKDWLIYGGVAVAAVITLVWFTSSLLSGVTTKRIGDDKPDLPAKGQFCSIASADTYWRAPVREGDNRDNAKPEVILIPVVDIGLTGEGAQGVLRILFLDEHGNYVGDPITKSFENGKFKSNNSETLEIASTDGFTTNSDFHAYRLNNNPWTVEILEGPSANAEGSRFQSILSVEISANSQ